MDIGNVDASDIADLIGNTPLLDVDGIFAKYEALNLSGSIKDRMAYYMLNSAIRRGELKAGSRILEVTSGNTGIAFSMLSCLMGFKFIAVMPEHMSIERRRMMEYFGAQLVLTPKKDDMAGAVKTYESLIEKYPDAWLPRQFENPDNIDTHRFGTAKEILSQTDVDIDAFVAGIGTGGTLIGTSLGLKERFPDMSVIGVEPAESAVLNSKKPSLHGIQGIGEGFIPHIVSDNRAIIDDVIMVKSADAIRMSHDLARKRGLFVGISSGANYIAARKIKSLHPDWNVVTIFPDRGDRYLSI